MANTYSTPSGVVPRKTFKSTFLISLGIHLVEVHFRPSQCKERGHLRPRTPRPGFSSARSSRMPWSLLQPIENGCTGFPQPVRLAG